jgi:FOG: PKD repeat
MFPVAAFSGTPTSGDKPLTVAFSDESTGIPTSWDWNFGDGSAHGNTENPSHEYTEYGNYTVTLKVTNVCGNDTETKTGYIKVAVPIYETLTTYTEVDPNGRIAVTTTRATGTGLTRSEAAYLYKDKGVNHFNALDINFVIKATELNGTSDILATLGLANSVYNMAGFGSNEVSVIFHNDDTHRYIKLIRGTFTAQDKYICSVGTVYYCTLSRAAGNDTITLKIYSDAARTNLLDTLSVGGFGNGQISIHLRFEYLQ